MYLPINKVIQSAAKRIKIGNSEKQQGKQKNTIEIGLRRPLERKTC